MPEQRDIRVLTLNLWGRHGRWPERRAVLIDGFRTLQPDVAAFQEAINTTDYDEVVDLLGPGFHVVHLTGREPDGTGVSIASRWPVTEFRELNLYVTPRVDPSRQGGRVGVVEIAAPDPVGPLLFVNHKPSGRLDFEHERELQAVGAAHLSRSWLRGAARMSCWPATSTPRPMRPACASGSVGKPCTATASVTGTRGRARIPRNRATHSHHATRW